MSDPHAGHHAHGGAHTTEPAPAPPSPRHHDAHAGHAASPAGATARAPVPAHAGHSAPTATPPAPLLMAASTIVVALNAQLLRRVDLMPATGGLS